MPKTECFPGNSDSKNRSFAKQGVKQQSLPVGFSVTAHAGALGLPENTISALLKAIESGVNIVEIDVSFRPDATPVIIHKDSPKQNEGVLLIDVFKAIKDKKVSDEIKINLDLKSIKNLATVQELVEKEGLRERVFFTGVDENWVGPVMAQSPLIPYYLNASTDKKQRNTLEYAQSFADRLIELNCIGLNCNYGEISKTLVDVLHKNSLLVSVWTVDKKKDMEKMLSLSVDNITTRKPNKFFDLLNSME